MNTNVKPPRVYDATPAYVLDRIYESFIHIYMTVIAIVQGLTLGYLVIFVDQIYAHLTPLRTTMIVIVLGIIIQTWIEYAINTMTFRWIPTFWDGILPIGFGIAETYTIHSIPSLNLWFFGAAATGLVALGAFLNLILRIQREPSSVNNQALLARLKPYRRFAYVASAGGGLVTTGFGILATLYKSQGQFSFLDLPYDEFATISTLSIAAVVLLFYIRGILYWGAIVKFARSERFAR